MAETISILDGSTFLVSDLRGDVDPVPDEPHGFFYRDTRFLSKWLLTANGSRLRVNSTADLAYFTTRFFLVPEVGMGSDGPTASVIRNRMIGDGFHEDVTVLNHDSEPLEIELRLEADADFADILEVKDGLEKKGRHYRRVEGEQLVLGYERDNFVRETRIRASQACRVDEDGFSFSLRLEPQAEWNTCLFVQPVADHELEIKYDTATRRRSRTSAPASRRSSTPRRASRPTGIHSRTSTNRASSTSPPCASHRRSFRSSRCPQRGCPGS
jgi:hypothetical protein